jgi:hypothetical protein
MAAGVFLSGIRDLYAACHLPKGGWPWRTESAPEAAVAPPLPGGSGIPYSAI